ncbi:MAG TPA: CoA pyrophosphatase [Pseudomonadales bacterium]
MRLDPDYIRARLQQPADCARSSAPPHLQAAVLVLLCPGVAEPVTILTRRSEDLPQHAGQISFPGGRVHGDDASLEATALREAIEETALDPSGLVLLGRLPVTVVQSSGFEITPVVAWTALRPQLRADPREVAELIECPLKLALDPALYRTGSLERDGQRREFWYIEFGGHHVWGATARILRSLALLLAETDEPQAG